MRLLALALFVSPFAVGVAEAAPYAVARSDVQDVVARSGAIYRLFMSWPEGPPPPAGYPILYLLDGEDSFATAAEAANRMGRFSSLTKLTPGVIIGIGYAGPTRRGLDYTSAALAAPNARPELTGGAEAFRTFLIDEVRPMIEARFKIDRHRQSLMGHSYGGLFVLDTLFARPDAFHTWVISSPSIWFGDGHILTGEKPFLAAVASRRLHPSLVMTVGEYEQAPPPGAANDPATRAIGDRNAKRRMVDNARELAGRLEAAGLAVRFRIFSGETHGSAPLSAIGNALPIVFGEKP